MTPAAPPRSPFVETVLSDEADDQTDASDRKRQAKEESSVVSNLTLIFKQEDDESLTSLPPLAVDPVENRPSDRSTDRLEEIIVCKNEEDRDLENSAPTPGPDEDYPLQNQLDPLFFSPSLPDEPFPLPKDECDSIMSDDSESTF